MVKSPIENDTELYAALLEMNGLERTADRLEKIIASGYAYNGLDAAQSELDATIAEIERVSDIIAPLELAYNESKWARYWIVTNSNGHVHNSTNCNTCYLTTEFSWLPQVSGMTDDEVIELAGERACTVCFPNAPVTKRPCQLDSVERIAAKAEREAKANAKAAEMAVKGITDIDGSPLRHIAGLDKGREIKTERGATNAIASDLYSYIAYNGHPFDGDWLANTRHLANAVAAKRGIDADAFYAECMAKATKKAEADRRKYSK